MTDTLLVIDGHSMAYRAFYALPLETFMTKTGQPTNAIYGFLAMLVRIVENEKPTHIAVAFDLSRHSFRTEEYPEYKGTRAETPDELKRQFALLREVLSAMGIVTITKENYEADDILATLARNGAENGFNVLLASGDRDTFQLINDQVTVLYPGKSASDLKYMTPDAVEKKYGVPPEQYPEIAALVGESSDNLPGVPGVGPKTAAQWIVGYSGLENLLESADQIGGKRGVALREHKEDVLRNRRLNRLVNDLDLPVSVNQLVLSDPDQEVLGELFDTLEFSGIRERVYKTFEIGEKKGDSKKTSSRNIPTDLQLNDLLVVDESFDLESWFIQGKGPWVVMYSGVGRPVYGDLSGFVVFRQGEAVAIDTSKLTVTQEQAIDKFFSSDPELVVHGGKSIHHAFQCRGWTLPEPSFDTELAAYLCRPESKDYAIENLATQYLGEEPAQEDEALLFPVEDEANNGIQFWMRQLAESASLVAQLRGVLQEHLEEIGILSLLLSMEIPLQEALIRMETFGVEMDVSLLDELSEELATEIKRSESDAFAAIGHEANLASPKQLQVILFEELNMPHTRKTKTGWSTDADALVFLFSQTQHPFLEATLRHRDYTKLRQLVVGLRNEVKDDGRIHTTFQQTVAATGRLASSDPNLQNIPARTDTGMRVREAFIAGKGFESLLSADYSQIEMRIMAHLSGDEELIEAFNTGEDLHKTMAAMVFDVPIDEVTPKLRNQIKATSYGLAYGLSAFGLSKQLDIPATEASRLHSQYFERFGGIRKYLYNVVEVARDTGYTETMFGRRRYLPHLKSTDHRLRESAERAALNAPIQGSAADIIKIATNLVEERLSETDLKTRIILQIHDELLFEVAPGESETVRTIVREAMANPVEMSVPLEIAIGEGKSWSAAAH